MLEPAAPSQPNTIAQIGQQVFNPSPIGSPSGGTALPPAQPNPLGGGNLPQQTPAPQAPAQPQLPPVVQPLPTSPAMPQGRSLLDSYVQRGLLPPNLPFRSDTEFVDRMMELVEQYETEREGQQPAAPAAPAAPTQPVVPKAPQPAGNLSQAQLAFQQAGMISFQNGQWVATNPLANDLVGQLNQQVMQQHQRLQELSDPKSFISQYGKDVIKQEMDPLLQEIQTLKQQNAEMQRQFQSSRPKPYEGFLTTHAAALRNPDNSLTAVGQLYDSTWKTASAGGVTDEAILHKLAEAAVNPYLRAPAPQAAQPPQTFMQFAAQSQPSDPGFNSPGTVLTNAGQTPIGLPLTNRGMPDMRAMMSQLPNQ